MTSIASFISREIAKPFAWGVTDCCSTADRRVEEITGRSPLALFGRPFVDEVSARAWLSEPGGIAVAVNRVMRRAGIARCTTPDVDDVALVMFGNRIAVGLWTGSIWWSRDEDGQMGASVEAAWKIWRIR